MSALATHAPYLASALSSLKAVDEILVAQDKKIAALEAEAQHLAVRNSELLDELTEVRDQRDALQRAHDRALAVIAEHQLRIR